jgi:serine/threonine protein kinase
VSPEPRQSDALVGDTQPVPGGSGVTASPLRPGMRLDQFAILGELGRGGMGAVYEAEDTLLQRRAAIKIVPGRSADRGTERLLKEARAVAKLDHPNVVRIYHVGRWSGGHYLVLELMAGGSLQGRLDGRAMPWAEATRALADACRGVAAAHAAGLVHRDIKPANLMCDAAGRVKVADFGLVRGPDLPAGTSLHGAGTPRFMSPEQCQGEPADDRSDVYALGATYYALLTGQPPYPSGPLALVMYAHCNAPVPDPRALRPDVPEACAAVVARAMAKAPADRYQSADEMLAALLAVGAPPAPEAVFADLTVGPGDATVVQPRRRPTNSGSRPVLLAGVVLLAGALGLAALWPKSNAKTDPTRKETASSTGAEKPGKTKGGEERKPNPTGGEPKGADRPPAAVPVEVSAAGRTFSLGGKVAAVGFSSDGRLFAAGVPDVLPNEPNTRLGVTVWETAGWKVRRRLGEGEAVSCLGFARGPDGRGGAVTMLVREGDRGPMQWFENDDTESVMVEGFDPTWGRLGAYAAIDGQTHALGYRTGSLSGKVVLYRWGTGGKVAEFNEESRSAVRELFLSPHDGSLAVLYANGTFAYWAEPTSDGARRRAVPGTGSGRRMPLAVSPTAAVAARALENKVAFWDTRRWLWVQPRPAVKGEADWTATDVTVMAFSPNGKYLAVGEQGGAVTLWDAREEKKLVRSVGRHTGAVLGLAFSPDGATLASGGADGTARLWNTPEGKR